MRTRGAHSRADEERRLFRRYRHDDDVAARNELVERFLPLARGIARRYAPRSESFDDLLQVASIGLIKAIDRFDPDYGVAFTSFAVPSIAGELKRHFRQVGWALRVPRSMQERVLKVNDAMQRLRRESGRSPTPHELAEAIGEDVESVLAALEAASAYDTVSLDRPLSSDDPDGDGYADTVGEVDRGYEFVEHRATIVPALRELPAREQLILRLRFEEDRTQSQIADVLDISQMHVSRLLRRALDQLRVAAGESA